MNQSKIVNRSPDGRGVLAILGPTNTGKTHLAIERMVAHESGVIGLPLRLLAREVYGRVAEKVGAAKVALITGEEKINAESGAPFQVCTVEAMPERTDAAFVAIDEVQIAADLERGHVFTDRLLNLRGRHETMLLGAETVQRTLQELLPGLHVVTRPRMSVLSWAGQKKITRLPRRSAVVAFSTDEVYAIAELIRRQRGGAAVVLGSLSPRTRNAQVALYQSGDVDFLVATDAIGMGLNLDLDHVAFAQDRKFDGFSHRRLSPAEMGQIAGRAGRHVRNGTFGVTGKVQPFDDNLVERLETHVFDPVKVLIWRNRALEFDSLDTLRDSLDMPSDHQRLMKSFPAPDRAALESLVRDPAVADACTTQDMIRLLWEICQIPDYRRISPAEHAELLRSIFVDLSRGGQIDEDWFAQQVQRTDRTDGDIDALSARIAHIRTWTYLSNRTGWLPDPVHWRDKTRAIEDRLSDALHESLTNRFIDRRTSVLMKRLRENAMLDAEIGEDGTVVVEGHHVGKLSGFRFSPDAAASGTEAKAANAAALKALSREIEHRAEKLRVAPNGDIVLTSDATMRWRGEPVARLVAGDEILRPRVLLLADEQLTGTHRDMVQWRLDRWLRNHIETQLKPLVDMAADQHLSGLARGIAFRIVENLGVVDRREIAAELQDLDQDMRAGLRRHGVRFGAYHVFVPALLKPAPVSLITLLWSLANDRVDAPELAEIRTYSESGRTSFPIEQKYEPDIYRIGGYRMLGRKAVRVDILERLADLIRPALAWRPGDANPPEGAAGGRAFYVTPAMLSILGATHEDMENVLSGLGYRGEKISNEAFAKLKASISGEKAETAQTAEVAEPAPPAEGAEEAGQSGDGNAAKPDATQEAPQASPQTDGEREETAVDEKAPAAETIAGEAAAGDAEAAQQQPERPAMLWHPARSGPRGREHGRSGRHHDNAGAGAGARTKKHPGRQRPKRGKGPAADAGKKPAKHGNQQKKREDRIDPDSPFAKLAQLKAEMNNRDG